MLFTMKTSSDFHQYRCASTTSLGTDIKQMKKGEQSTFDLGVGLSPVIDNTIQFSELPSVVVIVSGAEDEEH